MSITITTPAFTEKTLTWETINWKNEYEVKTWVNKVVVPNVYETLVDSYGFAEDDYDADDTIYHIHEIIDGLAEVIYNYQARKIAEAFDYDPFSSESELTGERFNSWNEMAYELIYNKVMEKYSEQLDI